MNIFNTLFSSAETAPARREVFTPLEASKAAELLLTVEAAVGNVENAVRHYDVTTSEVVGSVATEAVATSPEVQPHVVHELAQAAVEAPKHDDLAEIRSQVNNAYSQGSDVLQFPTAMYQQGDYHDQKAA